jgi:hypothetical protein
MSRRRSLYNCISAVLDVSWTSLRGWFEAGSVLEPGSGLGAEPRLDVGLDAMIEKENVCWIMWGGWLMGMGMGMLVLVFRGSGLAEVSARLTKRLAVKGPDGVYPIGFH